MALALQIPTQNTQVKYCWINDIAFSLLMLSTNFHRPAKILKWNLLIYFKWQPIADPKTNNLTNLDPTPASAHLVMSNYWFFIIFFFFFAISKTKTNIILSYLK